MKSDFTHLAPTIIMLRGKHLFVAILFFIYGIVLPGSVFPQIYEADGLRIPGTWNNWTNDHNMGGVFDLQKISVGTQRWHTTFQHSGNSGQQEFKFTSGTANPWQNEWRNTHFIPDQLQNVGYSGAGAPNNNNTVNLTQGKWYTVIWEDVGYEHSRALFMETTAEPVELLSLSIPEVVEEAEAVSIDLTIASVPSAEEIFYLRYSPDNWASSEISVFSINGTSGSAMIPGLDEGTMVRYFAFSSTVPGFTGDYDIHTIRLANNNGSNYSYLVGPPLQAYPVLFTVFDETTSYQSIELKGEMTSWSTVPMTEGPNNTWTLTLDLFPGTYEWGVIENDGSGHGIWLIQGPDLLLEVAANGDVSGTSTYTIQSFTLDWINLQWPPQATIEPSQPFHVYSQVWVENQTGSQNPVPGVQAWIGFSTQNIHPGQWDNWVASSYNGAAGNNDEFKADIGSHVSIKGIYYYASRFRSGNGDFVYGGFSQSGGGFWDGSANISGTLTVGHNIDCSAYAGVVTTIPAFPADNQSLTIFFDATKGNEALLDYNADVYAHTAVITNLSSGPEGWRYTKTSWGQNSPETLLTGISDNLYSLAIANPRNYYNVPAGETIEQMVFVFRSGEPLQNGEYLAHRNDDGSDIYVEIYEPGLNVRFVHPITTEYLLNEAASLPVCIKASEQAGISFYINDQLIVSDETEELSYMLVAQQLNPGLNWLVAAAESGRSATRDSVQIYRRGPVQVAQLPGGVNKGINYIDDETVTLVLHDPAKLKQFAYVIGDFNGWGISETYLMNLTPAGDYFWLTITGLESGHEYGFQYFIDAEIKIADPYTHKILDPWNDQWISPENYPDLKPYPFEHTTGIVGILHINKPEYEWQVTDFTPPALNHTQPDLVIYELLIRDFVESRHIGDAELKLDYLKELGVNAIQLMPIMEFDGNDSWGYAPNFFFATDKYYGTRLAYKQFIDAAHERNMAVILDIVPNHAFGQNPFVRMYYEQHPDGYWQPSAQNPWLNQQSPHPYSIGYDFNHESPHTRQFFKDVFEHWLTEFRVDGFRIDLSKGLTQTQSSNFGEWNAYDQSRINILTDYYNHIKWVNPNAYVILEHFANNDEETLLANAGMLLWSAMHNAYKQVAIGWEQNSDLSWAYHGTRGWTYPNLVDYMESHDEERMMFEALEHGNSSGSYNIRDTLTALGHQEQAIVLFMGIPGPKMIWQFQEMGYDYSIFYNGGRTAAKPPRWDYLDQPARERLNRVVSAMAALRKSEAFRFGNFTHDFSGNGKRMWISHSNMDVVISTNMGVNGFDMAPGFTKAGTWYNYFSGESFHVSDPGGHFFFYEPGEYRVFTSEPIPKPFHELEVIVTDSQSGEPIEGAVVSLSNSGKRYTDDAGKAWFLSLPQQITLTATKFGWLSKSVDANINADSSITIELDGGWDPVSAFANLQYPAAANIMAGQEIQVYAQVFIEEMEIGGSGYEDLQVWIGYHDEDTNPGNWENWFPASYSGISSFTNRPEYTAMIGSDIPGEGTWYYASRFGFPGQGFVYGGYSEDGGGFWDGTDNVSGILTVTLTQINWANLQWPSEGNIEYGQEFNVYGQVWINGITGGNEPAAGLQAWIGYYTGDTDPATWNNWIPAAHQGPSGNNDEFVVNLGAAINYPGNYYYAARYKFLDQDFVYGGFNGGFWDGINNVSGILTVQLSMPENLNLSGQISGDNCYNAGNSISIANMSIQGGATVDFNAGQTITVNPDADTFFDLQEGASATLNAGLSIIIRPQAIITPGLNGYFLASVTGPGNINWCLQPEALVANTYEPADTQIQVVSDKAFFSLYPNPGKGILYLEFFTGNEISPASIELYSMYGSSLLKRQLDAANKHKLDLTWLPPGMYILRISKGKASGVAKVNIQ